LPRKFEANRRSCNLKVKSPIHSGATFRTGLFALVAWLVLLPSVVAAQQITVNLDPAQTKIEWTLGDVLHTVHGTFKLKSGSVTFDPKSGDASGEIIVDATSGESGNHARDQKMHKEILGEQALSGNHVFSQTCDGECLGSRNI